MADDLTWLLRRLAETVPYTRSAVLLSADGIAKSWHGLDTDGADQLAAMASGLCSLAQGVGKRFGGGEGVRQVVAELGEIIMFVTAASVGTVLAVLADRDVDAGILSYEMGRLSTQVPAYLATPSRFPAGNGNR
jgi:predicted regulator of Ras-like GTPase activity (Roadblock/LC7/MglB family)